MSKYSDDLCGEIRSIVLNKKKTAFERCDDIYMLFKGGFFGKELMDEYPVCYKVIKETLNKHNIQNAQWLTIRFIDKFIKPGRLHALTDVHLKNTMGIQIPHGLSDQIRNSIIEEKKQVYEEFIAKSKHKFSDDVFDYTHGIYINDNTKMLMICQKCETHFNQTPKRHLTSKFPCFQCVMYARDYQGNDEKTDHWSRVLPGLYIGDIFSSVDSGFILNKRIRAVVDLTNSSQQPKHSRGIKINKINLDDSPNANVKPYLNQTHDFINNFLEKNQSILVYCRAGVSRSATIVIHYLMRRYNISYYDAYRFLKAKRHQIQPNHGFVQQLQEVEESMVTKEIGER